MILKIKDALDTINPDSDLIVRTERLLRTNTQKRKVQPYRSLVTAACFFILIGTMSIAGYGYYNHPVNYIDVDINPSLELAVNNFNRVVDVTFFNGDAEELISESSLTGCKPEEAVSLILQAASNSGYIVEGETSVVSLAAYGSNEAKATTVLQNCAEAAANENEDVAVYSTTVTNDLKSEADAACISAGKLNLIKMVQELEANAKVDDLSDDSISSIVNQLTYLASDANSGVSADNKNTVMNNIRDVTTQIQRIQEKNRIYDNQTPDAQSESSPVSSGSNQTEDAPSPVQTKTPNTSSGSSQPATAPSPSQSASPSGQSDSSKTEVPSAPTQSETGQTDTQPVKPISSPPTSEQGAGNPSPQPSGNVKSKQTQLDIQTPIGRVESLELATD